MRHVYLNLMCLLFLFYACSLIGQDEANETKSQTEEPEYVPDYDKIIEEYERDIDAHASQNW